MANVESSRRAAMNTLRSRLRSGCNIYGTYRYTPLEYLGLAQRASVTNTVPQVKSLRVRSAFRMQVHILRTHPCIVWKRCSHISNSIVRKLRPAFGPCNLFRTLSGTSYDCCMSVHSTQVLYPIAQCRGKQLAGAEAQPIPLAASSSALCLCLTLTVSRRSSPSRCRAPKARRPRPDCGACRGVRRHP